MTAGGNPGCEDMSLVIVTDMMEAAIDRDLDALRDTLPEKERDAFQKERHVHRQAIINHVAEHGNYPQIK